LTKITWETHASLGVQTFMIRQLENLAENRVSTSCLKNAFKGKTAILLGGGPSLDHIIPWLKTNKDKVVILAVSRICRHLLECGISPHMVFSVDPHPISFDISKELFHFWRNTLFVHTHHVSPPLLGQWRGKSVFSGPRFPWKTGLNVDTLPSAGPTVTNTALASAIEMGFSQVLLAGVDLCHSKEGFTHARGSDEHTVGPQLGKVGIRVETNGGWTAETSPDFAAAINIVEIQAKQALEKGCKVMNTAPGAAKVPSICYAPLDKIAIERPLEPPEKTIARSLPPESRDERITYYKTMQDELERAKNDLRKIRKLAKEALKSTERLQASRARNADLGQYRRMNKIEKTLNRNYKDLVSLVKQFGIRSFLRIIRPGEENAYIEGADRVSRLKNYYRTYVDSTGTITDLIENAEKRLHARLEEEKDMPNIDLLIEQWQKDQQPGRSLVWKERNPEAEKKATISHSSTLRDLENELRNIMEERETDHMRLIRKNINLSGVRSKALTLFQRKGIEELHRLIDGLDRNSDAEAKNLLCLARGYMAELYENMEEAIEEYNKLLSEENDPALLEDALRRIAVICIDNRDTENAVTALQCLTQLSATYAPQYAEILRLTGDSGAAAEIYSDYLQKVPDDLGTMLKLGHLYKDMQADEAAQMAFNYVLERDPENGAAKAMLGS
jgi:tetratricopeptide (TPR) repeat protein